MPGHDALQEYRRKRDFERTSEPASDSGPRNRRDETLSFVIQKHAARALHYDFRLELDGSLKSWAVPKGPSLDPHDKRMAVHVEDHPLSYASFEGVIPPGQYGAGTVIVWDRGEWRPIGDPREGMRAGKLKFELRGEKLHGQWTLVRMRSGERERQEPWLLIKERDAEARPATEFDVLEALPDSVMGGLDEAPVASSARKSAAMHADAALPLTLAPQLATLVDRAPASGDWLWELKFDGYRLLARIDARNDVRLFTRMGHDWTAKLKRLARMIAGLHIGPAWLDGEIVVPGPDGAPDFQALQNAFESAHAEQVVYYLFDLPFHRGEDLRALGVRERRARLEPLLRDAPPALRFSESFDVAPGHLLLEACRLRMEGLIGKRADAPYRSRRTTDWVKLKCTQRQEFVVVGYTDPKSQTGGRSGFGSLLLAIHDADGELRYVGNVGSGFDAAALQSVFDKMAALRQDASPLPGGLPSGLRAASTHWIKPRLVAEVSFAAWTQDSRLRHAVFHGLRGDKPAAAITREEPMKRSETVARPALPKTLRLSNPQRIVDLSTGTTKLDLAEHYAAVAELMLPHLRGRPVSLVRAPDGLAGELFFQKHGEDLGIPGLRQLDPELDPGHPPLLEIANARALLGAVQMNVIEFHTWNARARLIEKPDRMTFDLDPGEGVPWSQVQEGARLVQTLLQELALDGWLKTSGGKGLHIVVPIRPQHDWDTVKALAQAIVRHLAETLPQRFVAKSGPKNRIGRIFVDYLRNGRGATTVAAWSVRARPGLGVSVPVAWDELEGLVGGAHWTVATVGDRLATGNAPWVGMAAKTRQGVAAAMRALDFIAPE